MYFERGRWIFSMKVIKKFMAAFLACAMVLAMSATAFAAEPAAVDEATSSSVADNNDPAGQITPRTTRSHIVGNSYKNMTGDDLRAPHGNGIFYYQVTSSGYNGWVYQINCIMYDVNGTVVWREDNICGVAANGSLEYGGNIVRIDLQIAPRLAVTPENFYEITVTY